MQSYHFLFDIALVLISTKLLGLLTRRIAMPQVVGALLAGLILGPALLGVVHETSLLNQISEIGVIVLMFNAGLETDISELKRSGKAAFIIASVGVVIPLIGGFILADFFNVGPGKTLQNVFIGVVLTATSVSITVETLKEIGKLSTRSGNAILGAALIDDILGIVALTIINGLSGGDTKLSVVLLKIVAFFAVSSVMGYFLHKLVLWWFARPGVGDKRRYIIIAFAFFLLYAYFAETIFGVADITGAYIAGLILAKTPKVTYFAARFETLSYMLLSPVFFASIGLKVELPKMNSTLILFSVLLIILAVASKVIGCGFGARLCHYSNEESLQIGVGMVSRGEVALIVANNGIATGLMVQDFFGPLVIMVVVTTIVTPILLRIVYKGKKEDVSDLVQSPLVERYESVRDFDMASQTLLDMHERIAERGKQAVGQKDNAQKKP